MRKTKTTYLLGLFFFITFFLFSENLNAQNRLIGIVRESNTSKIFTIQTDGTDYNVIDPCMPLPCGLELRLLGFNLDNELLFSTQQGGANNLGSYFKMGIDGEGILKLHDFENDTDPYKFQKTIKTKEGNLYGIPSILLGEGVYNLASNGAVENLFFSLPSDDVFNFIEGDDGVFYAAGNFDIYKIDKSNLEITLIKSFFQGPGVISIGFNIFKPLNNHLFGIIYGSYQGPNGTYLDFQNLVKMETDGSNYSVTDYVPYGILTDSQNDNLYLIYGNSIVKSNSDLIDTLTIKSFDTTTGFSLQKIILGEDGYLYGTTRKGGQFDKGTLFRVKNDGTEFTILKHLEQLHYGLLEWKEETTLMTSINKNFNFKVYPNPVAESLFIEYPNLENESVEIFVFDCLGKKVFQTSDSSEKKELPVSFLQNGVYYLKAIGDFGIYDVKFIKM